jgi:hypothetical protein
VEVPTCCVQRSRRNGRPAFHTVPTMANAANRAWQRLVVLTHNLLNNFQIETGAPRRAPTRRRTVLPLLETIQTLRFTVFHRAAQLVRPGGAFGSASPPTTRPVRRTRGSGTPLPICPKRREFLSHQG